MVRETAAAARTRLQGGPVPLHTEAWEQRTHYTTRHDRIAETIFGRKDDKYLEGKEERTERGHEIKGGIQSVEWGRQC